jgi:dolichol-phosphate mannosyltransferase
MRALVIVPTYNECENLPLLIPSILAQGHQFEVLVVDDNSPDGTGEIADQWAARTPRVHVIHRSGTLGLGTAYIAGFKFALARAYDVAFEMDADFSHDPKELPRLLDAVRHADVAIGSRWVDGGGTVNWSLLRTLISRGGSLYAGSLLGLPIRDLTGGYKCFRRRVLAALDLDAITSNGYAFQVEVNYYCHALGFHVVEVPIRFTDRTAGTSKMSTGIVFEAAKVVWQLRGTPAPTAPSVPEAAPVAGVARGRRPRLAELANFDAVPLDATSPPDAPLLDGAISGRPGADESGDEAILAGSRRAR